MDQRFKDKVVLITGGGTGIGRGIARRFAAEGAHVVVTGRRPEPLERVAGEIAAESGQVSTYTLDVRDVLDIQRVVGAVIAARGRIDVLINNAGVAGEGAFLEVTPEYYDDVLGTNLRGAYFMAQQVAKAMIASNPAGGRQRGSIVNITSIDATAADGPYSTYCTAKAGLVNLTRCMAFELAEHKIRVNAVAPGFTMTEMTSNAVSAEELDYLQNRFHRVPARRLGTVEECAALVAFLASDEAPYITGENVTIDGGLTANLFIFESFALMNGSQG
ncbi:MAG: SDR family oxidoreductase [Chloroflexi bacterium]|nr:SDR family oxidoreductase [Chloroflexota bacterium]